MVPLVIRRTPHSSAKPVRPRWLCFWSCEREDLAVQVDEKRIQEIVDKVLLRLSPESMTTPAEAVMLSLIHI